MEGVIKKTFRNKSPKIIFLLAEEKNSPKTPSPPRSGKKKMGQPSPMLSHIERVVIENEPNDKVPVFNL